MTSITKEYGRDIVKSNGSSVSERMAFLRSEVAKKVKRLQNSDRARHSKAHVRQKLREQSLHNGCGGSPTLSDFDHNIPSSEQNCDTRRSRVDVHTFKKGQCSSPLSNKTCKFSSSKPMSNSVNKRRKSKDDGTAVISITNAKVTRRDNFKAFSRYDFEVSGNVTVKYKDKVVRGAVSKVGEKHGYDSRKVKETEKNKMTVEKRGVNGGDALHRVKQPVAAVLQSDRKRKYLNPNSSRERKKFKLSVRRHNSDSVRTNDCEGQPSCNLPSESLQSKYLRTCDDGEEVEREEDNNTEVRDTCARSLCEFEKGDTDSQLGRQDDGRSASIKCSGSLCEFERDNLDSQFGRQEDIIDTRNKCSGSVSEFERDNSDSQVERRDNSMDARKKCFGFTCEFERGGTNSQNTFDSKASIGSTSCSYLDFTELDVIPYSQFEYNDVLFSSPDILSESGVGVNKLSHFGRLVKRRSPRLSSGLKNIMGDNVTENVCEPGKLVISRTPVNYDKKVTKQSKKSLIVTSVFQYIIDEAKRNKDTCDFVLPIDMFQADQLQARLLDNTRMNDSPCRKDKLVCRMQEGRYACRDQPLNDDQDCLRLDDSIDRQSTDVRSEMLNKINRILFTGASVRDCVNFDRNVPMKQLPPPCDRILSGLSPLVDSTVGSAPRSCDRLLPGLVVGGAEGTVRLVVGTENEGKPVAVLESEVLISEDEQYLSCVEELESDDCTLDFGEKTLKTVSQFQVGKTESIISILCGGLHTSGCLVDFVVTLTPTSLAIWSQEGHLWVNTINWFLSMGSEAKQAWLLPCEDKVVVLVLSTNINIPVVATIFVYDWMSEDSNKFNLPLTLSQTCGSDVGKCCLVTSHELAVFYRRGSLTCGQKLVLGTKFVSVVDDVTLEGVRGGLVSVSSVQDLSDALVGLTDTRRLCIWNHRSGALLQDVLISPLYDTLFSMTLVQSFQGFLVFTVLGKNGVSTIAVNPITAQSTVLVQFDKSRSQKSVVSCDVYEDMLITCDKKGSILMWDVASGRLLADRRHSNTTSFTLDPSQQRMFTGQKDGCVHILQFS